MAVSRNWEGRVREVKRLFMPRLTAYPNVTGLGVGYRIVGGQRQNEVCLRVYVSKKVPEDALQPDEILPRRIDNVRVDVVESDFRTLQGIHDLLPEERRLRHPILLVGGVSVGGLGVTAGTLGGSVFDAGSGQQLMLSNWHVLCGQPACEPGDEIIQPGIFDGGTTLDVVARLTRFVLSENVDAACAELSAHRYLLPVIAGIGYVRGVGSAVLGMRVRKSGRTTGTTIGWVDDVAADIRVRGYPEGPRWFRNQIGVSALTSSEIPITTPPIALGGDSGSLVVDDENRAVGLLFAGDHGHGWTYTANPIAAVLSELGIGMALDLTVLDSHTVSAATLG